MKRKNLIDSRCLRGCFKKNASYIGINLFLYTNILKYFSAIVGEIFSPFDFNFIWNWNYNVKIIKLHLDKHNTIDLLRKIDINFCKRIHELWLHTNDISKHQELEHGSDVISIFAKFENLTSLYFHLSPILMQNISFRYAKN